MKRIFVQEIKENTALDKENKHYLKNVLRLKLGDKLLTFDGQKEAICIFEENSLKFIKTIREAEKSEKIRLAIAQIQATRLEWLIEKATELGVDEIFILKTERTQKHARYERLKKIAIEAVKQSNRITIPKIHEPTTLNTFIKEQDKNWYFGHITTKNKESSNLKSIIIGPEGGWSEQEIEILEKNYTPIKLGNYILRAETAAIIGLTKIIAIR